jgi:hypothetical protein
LENLELNHAHEHVAMRGAVKRSFAETVKKGDGILNVLEPFDSIKPLRQNSK